MKRYIIFAAIFLFSILLILFFLKGKKNRNDIKTTISVADVLSNTDNSGFARADSIRNFSFPADHGPHPNYQSEWWYFTGNVTGERGELFGFQFTIFRNALSPDSQERSSAWATNQVYMAHFALTDVNADQFHYFERFSRGALKLAGAQAQPFHTWLENWSAEATGADIIDSTTTFQIQCEEKDIALSLVIRNTKPVVLQGNRGLSQKGEGKGNASYYYSLTRLATQGEIQISDNRYSVDGSAWLDREWSTSALGLNQVGWDWFSIQLDNGWDIMFYQIRQRDGSIDPFSHGTIVDPAGNYRPLLPEQVELEVMDYWKNPGNVRYPSGWRLRIPAEQIELTISPYIKNQELDVTIRYWEGAVKIDGTFSDSPVQGSGYVELTGY